MNAPDYIKEDLDRLGLNDSIKLTFSKSSCSAASVKVCFSEETCDVNVDIVGSFVRKDNKKLYYQGNLIYGAIFGDSGTYECQVSRIIKRAAAIASLYSSKAEIVGSECSSAISIGADLKDYRASLLEYSSSEELQSLAFKSESLKEGNERVYCKLF